MAGRDSAFLTEKIREANDIVDVVGAFVTLRRAGRNFRGLCPFHSEKSPSFHVLPEKQIFKCFGCGAGGDVFKFIQLRDGINFPEAREVLARRVNISLETAPATSANSSDQPGKNDIERVNRWAARWFRAQYESAAGAECRAYVASRGLTDETSSRFELGYAPAGWSNLVDAARKAGISDRLLDAAGLTKRGNNGAYDAFRNRLIFPIHDALARIIGFGGRALDDDPAKYLNSPQTALFDKSRCLYGLRESRESWRTSRRAIVTEGYLDCILCQQAGFADVVATLGTAMTPDHVRLIQRYVDMAIVVFDADPAGLRAADRAIDVILPLKLEVRVAQVPEGLDPADVIVKLGASAFDGFLTSSLPALEFKWNQVSRLYQDAAGDGDRRRAVEAFLGVVAAAVGERSVDPIQRGFILNQVGKLLGLTTDQVERQLRIVGRRLRASAESADRGTTSRFTPLKDGEQAALREILSVLLIAPDRFAVVADVFDPAQIVDPADRRIAEGWLEFHQSGVEANYDLARLISRFDDADTARRITDLSCSCEERGNYDATIEGAVARLRAIDTQRRLRRALSSLRAESGSAKTDPSMDETAVDADGLETVLQTARKSNHFVAHRHLAALTKTGADRRVPTAPGGDARPAR